MREKKTKCVILNGKFLYYIRKIELRILLFSKLLFCNNLDGIYFVFAFYA